LCLGYILVALSNSTDAREGRGLEDTVFGVCHNQGMGWKNRATVVDEDDILKDQVTVHWARLVDRPECVDRVDIEVNNVKDISEDDPKDKTHLSYTIQNEICEKTDIKIHVLNKRGGFGGKPDENHNYKTTISPLGKASKFIYTDKLPIYSVISKDEVEIDMFTDLFKNTEFWNCVTHIEILYQNKTFQGNKKKMKIPIKTCETQTLEIVYFHNSQKLTTLRPKIENFKGCRNETRIVNDPDNTTSANPVKEPSASTETTSISDQEASIARIVIPIASAASSIVILLVGILICVACRRGKGSSKEIEAIDDNPYYGDDENADYVEGDTNIMDTNDYYES